MVWARSSKLLRSRFRQGWRRYLPEAFRLPRRKLGDEYPAPLTEAHHAEGEAGVGPRILDQPVLHQLRVVLQLGGVDADPDADREDLVPLAMGNWLGQEGAPEGDNAGEGVGGPLENEHVAVAARWISGRGRTGGGRSRRSHRGRAARWLHADPTLGEPGSFEAPRSPRPSWHAPPSGVRRTRRRSTPSDPSPPRRRRNTRSPRPPGPRPRRSPHIR